MNYQQDTTALGTVRWRLTGYVCTMTVSWLFYGRCSIIAIAMAVAAYR